MPEQDTHLTKTGRRATNESLVFIASGRSVFRQRITMFIEFKLATKFLKEDGIKFQGRLMPDFSQGFQAFTLDVPGGNLKVLTVLSKGAGVKLPGSLASWPRVFLGSSS